MKLKKETPQNEKFNHLHYISVFESITYLCGTDIVLPPSNEPKVYYYTDIEIMIAVFYGIEFQYLDNVIKSMV